MIIDKEGINYDKKEVRVLVLNGGGSHIGIPLKVMQSLEEICGSPIAEYFDMIAGVSSGSIVGAGLLTPGADGKGKYDVDYFINNMFSLAKGFLQKSWLEKILPLPGLFRPYCVDKYKNEALEKLFGDTKVGGLNKNFLVLATDIIEAKAVYISRYISSMICSQEYLVKDIIGGSTSYPGAFGPVIVDKIGEEGQYALADGGTTSVNPSLLAIMTAKIAYPNAKIQVLDLGSGNPSSFSTKQLPFKWGEFQWGKNLNGLSLPIESGTNFTATLGSLYNLTQDSVRYVGIHPTLPKNFPGSFAQGTKVEDKIIAFATEFATEQYSHLVDFVDDK